MKEWISRYLIYFNVYQQYLVDHGYATVLNTTNVTSNFTGNASAAQTNATQNVTDDDSLLNNTSGNRTVVVVPLSLESFWNSTFDTANISVTEIISSLNETSEIYNDTISWFLEFFGENGVIIRNVTLPKEEVD